MDTGAPSRGLAGWAVLAVLLLTAAGGTAATRGGILLGVPSLAVAAGVLGAVALAAWRLGLEKGGPLLGLAWLPALVWAIGFIPGLRAVTGPVLLALAAAGAVAVIVRCEWQRPARFFLPIVIALYALVAWRVQVRVGPHGDEPHYLMVAESILRDGDLRLEQDYAEGRYRAFTNETLAPHYRVRGRDQAIYSVHAIGLSILVLPAYALGGYPAVSFFMALLAALLVREVRALVRAAGGSERLGLGVAALVAVTPPLVHFVGLVFTEVPAALVVARSLRLARDPEGWTPGRLSSWALPLVLLPWFNVRYAPVTAILLLYAAWSRPSLRRVLALAAPAAVSAVGIATYHFVLYGFFDPRLVWGRRPEFAWRTLGEGVPGLLLDQEFGLLVYAPVFVLCAGGLVRLVREAPRLGWTSVALVGVVLGTAGSWHMWRGGFNPPARFLVPLLPVFALALGAALRTGVGAAAALLAGWSVWTGLAGAWTPELVHRDRDGTAPFFRAWSGAEEWTRLLPGFVLDESAADRWPLALLWTGVLVAAAATPRRGAASGVGLGAAALGLVAAAAGSSALTHARTEGRDAVRVIGQPAVQVPGWGTTREARWDASALVWGPLYEPHRHPDGAPVGARLVLPPGRYQLELVADVVGGVPPALEVRPEGVGRPRSTALAVTASGCAGTFEIGPEDGAVGLRLHDGSPLVLKEIRLLPSTFS